VLETLLPGGVLATAMRSRPAAARV